MLVVLWCLSCDSGPGVTHCVSAFGVIGFVRFVLGYYLILVTQREAVGHFGISACAVTPHLTVPVGGHWVYAVRDAAMIPLPHPDVWEPGKQEKKKRSAFQCVS